MAAFTTAAALAATGPAAAASEHKPHEQPPVKAPGRVVGDVYTETNDPSGNHVIVFSRHADGTLKYVEAVATGGDGGRQAQPGCNNPCPILDAQGEVALAAGDHLLFAVNAGSNTISSFRVTARGLKLVDTKSSGGTFPDSVTTHDNLLYVVNDNSDNVSGLRFSKRGLLTPIKTSSRPLSSPGALPRQISFTNNGKLLVVTLFKANRIDMFVMRRNGTPGPAFAYPSTSGLPFGFALTPRDQLVVSQVVKPGSNGDTATYKVSKTGKVTAIATSPADGPATCWVAITGSGRYAFVVNTGAVPTTPPSVARYQLKPDGRLILLGTTVGSDSANSATDETLSRDSRYLYVLRPGVEQATSQISEYEVGADGSLKLIGDTARTMAGGASGLAGT